MTQLDIPVFSSTGHLVLLSSSLASLELLEVPSTDLHVTAVLVEALCELLGSAGAVVAPLLALVVGLAGNGVVLVHRVGDGAGAAEAEEA
jgi:hypothetical protein